MQPIDCIYHTPALRSAVCHLPTATDEAAARGSVTAIEVEGEEEQEDDATASASLHIKNFTRPLQLKEVTDLLSENGTLIEGADGFWMDRQKRRCCCTVC